MSVRALVTVSIAVAMSATMIGTATAGTHHKKKTTKVCHSANGIRVTKATVCKGLKFYKGKTITSYNIASIGGPFYDLVVAEQPLLEKYLGATVDVTSITTGNSVPGQNALAHSNPDGLTIGVLNTLNDVSLILTKTPGINFNPARLAFLSASGPSTQPLVALPGSGYNNWQDVYNGGKQGKLKMLTELSGTVNTLFRVWMGVMGFHPQWITGYSHLTQMVEGFLRGDGPLSIIGLSNSCNYIQGHKMIPLVINAVPPAGTNCRALVRHLPTWSQLAKKYGKTKKQQKLWTTLLDLNAVTGTPTVTQSGVAGYKVAALRAALKWVYKQGSFKKTMLFDGLNPEYVNPRHAKANYIRTVKLGGPITCYIKGTC